MQQTTVEVIGHALMAIRPFKNVPGRTVKH